MISFRPQDLGQRGTPGGDPNYLLLGWSSKYGYHVVVDPGQLSFFQVVGRTKQMAQWRVDFIYSPSFQQKSATLQATRKDVLVRTFLSIMTIRGVHVGMWGVHFKGSIFHWYVSVLESNIKRYSAVIRHPFHPQLSQIRWVFISSCWHTKKIGVLFESKGSNLQTFYCLQSLFWVLNQHWESNDPQVAYSLHAGHST